MNQDQAITLNQSSLDEGRVYLTHNYTCGACSTLHALSIYLNLTDLKTPVATCAKEHVFSMVKATECLIKETGF